MKPMFTQCKALADCKLKNQNVRSLEPLKNMLCSELGQILFFCISNTKYLFEPIDLIRRYGWRIS